jgi:hypothetical protein
MMEYAEEAETAEVEKSMAILTPEGIVMMLIAIALDLVGLILTIIWLLTLFGVLSFEIPEIINWISDGIGFVFFGLWLWVRSAIIGSGTKPKGLAERVAEKHRATQRERERLKARIARTVGRRGLRFALALIGEFLPLIGALPFWSWFVYSEMKS